MPEATLTEHDACPLTGDRVKAARRFFRDLGGMHLLITNCDQCRHLTLHGFPHQFLWRLDGEDAVAETECENCGKKTQRREATVTDA